MGHYNTARPAIDYNIFLDTSLFDQSGQTNANTVLDGTSYRDMSAFRGYKYRDMRKTLNGSELMSFEVTLQINQSSVSVQDVLSSIFFNGLGMDGKFYTEGQVVWRGLLKQMELTYGFDTEGYDLDQVCNRIKFRYDQDENDNNPLDTGTLITADTVETLESQARWGVRMCEFEDTEMGITEANEHVAWLLKQNLSPRLLPLGDADNTFRLYFEFWGYEYILDWMCADFVFKGKTLQQCFLDVLGFANQGIINFSQTSIQNANVIVNEDFSGTALDAIRFLAERLDSQGLFWNWFIEPESLTFFWQPINFEPYYYKRYGESRSSSGTFVGRSGNKHVGRFKMTAGKTRRSSIYPVTDRRGELFNDSLGGRKTDMFIEAVSFDEYGNPSPELLQDKVNQYRRHNLGSNE